MRILPSSKRGKVLLGAIVVFLLIQAIPTGRRNEAPVPDGKRMQDRYVLPDSVMTVLRAACYDCHSNRTVYPWYSRIQPVGWWLDDHIRSGKAALNFDEFASYSLRKQQHKFESIVEQIEQNEMPLPAYIWMHRKAHLTPVEKRRIIVWAKQYEGIK